jgi:hypothetical protein
MPASAGHASVERLFRHRKRAAPIFQRRYDRSGFQLGREDPFWAMAKTKSASTPPNALRRDDMSDQPVTHAAEERGAVNLADGKSSLGAHPCTNAHLPIMLDITDLQYTVDPQWGQK